MLPEAKTRFKRIKKKMGADKIKQTEKNVSFWGTFTIKRSREIWSGWKGGMMSKGGKIFN